jgi:hypothetical protein
MESKTHHLKHIATQIGNLIHKFISKINVPCSKSFGVCISKDIIADLLDKLREGYATTVVTCGATKAGKSTFLNYLIGVDSDILAEQFVPMFFFDESRSRNNGLLGAKNKERLRLGRD